MNSVGTLNSYSEKILYRITCHLAEYRFPVFSSVLFGLLSYMFAFTNKLVNLDDLSCLFNKGVTIESGRWGLHLMSLIFPDFSIPWVYGMMSLMLITIGICICINLFSIRNRVLQVLIAGIIVTFPSQTATFAYMFTAAPYAVSFLLSVSAAYLMCRGGWKARTAALFCLIFSVSIYQAYVSITAALLILYLIKETICSDKTEKAVICEGLLYVCFLALALGIYWVITKAVWVITDISMGAYADEALVFNIDTLFSGAVQAYRSFYRVLRYREQLLISSFAAQLAHILCFAIVGVEVVCWVVSRQSIFRSALLLFLLAILPLGINCMYIFINVSHIYILMMYAFFTIYILFAIVLEARIWGTAGMKWEKCRARCADAIILCLSLMVISNVYFANITSLNLYMRYENAYSFATTVTASLQNTPGYTTDTKVALVGEYTDPDFYDSEFRTLQDSWALMGITPNTYSIPYMFEYYNGVSVNFATSEEIAALKDTPQFLSMPSYPDYGCIEEINGIMVVKLSDR